MHLRELFVEAFPIDPLPSHTPVIDQAQDFRQDFDRWIGGKSWDKVTVHDWSMCPSPAVLLATIGPSQMHYYFPSLALVGAENPEYLEAALSMTKPLAKSGKENTTWLAFRSTFTASQELVVRRFLETAESLCMGAYAPLAINARERYWYAVPR